MEKSLEKLIESGIPCKYVKFHDSVDNEDDVPEYYFSEKSNTASRRATIVWTPYGMFISQKEGSWFTAPLPMVKYAKFK